MTPFGERVRVMRRARGISQKEMASAIGISAAYLSALEHGYRSPPNWMMVQKFIGFFNVIWDEAEELQCLADASHPRVVVDTAGLSPKATELANVLSSHVADLDDEQLATLLDQLRRFTSETRE